MSSSTVPVHGEVYSCYWYNDVKIMENETVNVRLKY